MIAEWLAAHQEDIQTGQVRVFVVDECHLKGGDICGYGWAIAKSVGQWK